MKQAATTRALLALLAERASRPAPATEDVAAYEEAAAVLASVSKPDDLRPFRRPADGRARTVLGNHLIPASGKRFEGDWMLAPEVRYRAIKRLAQLGQIPEALLVNPDERRGLLQRQLELYLTGIGPDLEQQSLDELKATLQVAVWLKNAVPGVPAKDAIERRLGFFRLLAPFEAIAGDGIFRGREQELAWLEQAVSVPLKGAVDARPAETGRFAPTVSIFGPDGVGKSALVARFLLNHVKVPEASRTPFAYFDFNRRGLDVADPYGLVLEMTRQLDVEFASGRFARIRRFAVNRSAKQADLEATERVRAAESLLADVLGLMGKEIGTRQYLVVLDTFEEVQLRDEARAFRFWEMLGRLYHRWPFLRVIVCGRAPLQALSPAESLSLAEWGIARLQLDALDTHEAVAFLEAQGIRDEGLALRLAQACGGIPLSLTLAAALVAKDPNALPADVSSDIGTTLVHVSDEVLQGQLYGRLLDHIADERVRRLAHYGLVLRRITPELILEVLNGPCELGLTTMAEANALFEALGRETSLVAVDDTDGALVHRSDLLRVTSKLLVASEPARVTQIRRAAVAYYDRTRGRRGSAERTYHHLHLGERVSERIFKDPEVRLSIQSAVVEFPADIQLWLSTLGFDVPDSVEEAATAEQQETATAARIEALLPNGPSAVYEAERVLREAEPLFVGHPSPLTRAAARIEMQLGRAQNAAEWIQRGLAQSATENATLLTLRLLQEKAWLEVSTSSDAAYATLRQLVDYATRHDDRPALVQCRLHEFALSKKRHSRDLDALAHMLGELTPLDVWGLLPATRSLVDEAIRRESTPVIEALRRHVLEPEGTFRQAGFADSRVQERLARVLAADAGLWKFGRALRNLIAGWPYRILFVDPPEPQRGEELAESAN